MSESEIGLPNQERGKELEYQVIAVNKAGEGFNIMADVDVHSSEAITDRLHRQTEADRLRITAHAHQEMVEEDISLDDVIGVLGKARLVENYPDHRRGACCLVCGQSGAGAYVHVVCTTSLDIAIIITVYKPKPSKWITPFKRGKTE